MAPSGASDARARVAVARVRRLLGHRLVQFGLIGAAIFAVSAGLQRSRHAIALTRAQLLALRDGEAQRKGTAPTSQLTQAVEERALEDEVLYREGLALGFDRNDAIVRQRVIQKTLYLAEELAGASETPTDAELRAFFAATPERWKRPERFHLQQAFAHERADAERIAARAAAGEDLGKLGEACPLPSDVTMTRERIAAMVGEAFAQALEAVQPGAVASIQSALGWHVVRVVEHAPAQDAPFEEVRERLLGAYVVERRERAVATYLEQSFAHYRVTLDGAPVTAIHPNGRVATRKSASAED
jgi:parvulin-like peptidyl-prolyl isomerase